ncbi:hypothetical protein Hsw_PA0244 (plasmid) [Hymenobacter swuensis DY53]|uniref:Uncharacterized protein n=1 Tax=Hymenobacter swuensis DY53 TaxID=1227739 RepID=W8EV21_9BACT|nr:hypothetical protein Hsw_PA0244 [Hymenobacter swuensis DY53]
MDDRKMSHTFHLPDLLREIQQARAQAQRQLGFAVAPRPNAAGRASPPLARAARCH